MLIEVCPCIPEIGKKMLPKCLNNHIAMTLTFDLRM